MIRALQPMLDRNLPRGEVNDSAGNEEGRDAPRTLLVEGHGGVVDRADAADARTDQDAAGLLIRVGFRMPVGIVERLAGSGHGIDDERIDLALLLGLHPQIGIEGAVGAVAEGQRAGDPAREVVGLERGDRGGSAVTGDEAAPGMLDAATQRRNHP
ncbi:UNVERIFIED_ORG: hypothetical protein M2438_000922 [Methylobacterium sp. SuP10 SLI 274]|nr:hypothetical protein [Methylobacterium sp. SuP10 SLI 274]